MKKKLWWNWIFTCMVTLLMVIPAGGVAQAQTEIQYILFTGGTQKSILTYGLHAALSQTWRIDVSSSGSFSVNVPFATTTAPTKDPPPFSIEVMNLQMQGTWNDKDAQGTFTLTGTINTTRTTYAYLDDPMGNDEWYYVTKYQYYDNVTASGTINRETDHLVFSMNAVVSRTGNSRLTSVIVNDGQTTTGDNPVITDKSGTFSETASYSFLIYETSESEPAAEPTPTDEPQEWNCPEIHCNRDTNPRAIVRFGDLHGEVNVREDWEDDDAYLFAELGMGLCHCDRIKTYPRSGAILSFSDMSSFIMKEDSIIVLDIAIKRETKIGLLVGNIMVNMKKMIEDGSMEVEMSQAVAGIKGTTVIFEENGTNSTIKVIEGTVEVRPNTGAPLTLSDGEMVSATNGIASAVVPFSIEDEMQTWDENGQQMIAQALEESKAIQPRSSSPTWIIIGVITGLLCFGLIVVILLAGLAGFIAKKKKKKTSIDRAFQSDAIKSQMVPILPTSHVVSPKPPELNPQTLSGNELTPSEQPNLNDLNQWQCACGRKNAGLFCPKCGLEKPTSTDVQKDATT
ncbi:MAG: FecR domain-containing protein [Anaerolineaceae bacterium]|nr:FecR domain-containing protein [Anaerolineaceae bacterium]